MPIACGIQNGIDASCDSLRKPGGLGREAWAFNLSDLRNALPVSSEGYITDLPLNTYQGLYKFSSAKYNFEYTWTEQTGDGGNKSYQISLTLRLFNSTPTDDAVIEDLGVSETVFVIKTNAGEYLILGAENGLSSDGSTGGAGRQATDPTTSSVVLVGVERFLPKRLNIASGTAAYLEAMTI